MSRRQRYAQLGFAHAIRLAQLLIPAGTVQAEPIYLELDAAVFFGSRLVGAISTWISGPK
jgi:hypothetical protein